MDSLVLDIIHIIHNHLDFISQSDLRSVSKYFMFNFPVTNLSDGILYRQRLTDEILQSYLSVIKLNAEYTHKITNVNSLIHLRVLNAPGNCQIDDNGISRLTSLTSLNI